MTRAFDRLSPSFRKRLEGLRAVHTTAKPMERELRDNGLNANLRRGITKSIHPVVTVHPVTGQKALLSVKKKKYFLPFLFTVTLPKFIET